MAETRPAADSCQHPNPPHITGSANEICRGAAVTLKATGCAGQLVWSTGETGAEITVYPQQTTKYTAICRSQPGCISCFADAWTVAVNTPEPPVLNPSATVVCAGDVITLTATSGTGTIRWDDQTVGPVWTGPVQQTTVFRAVCEQHNCVSSPSAAVSVQVAVPVRPTVSVSSQTICMGQSVQLTASACLGQVQWNDGGSGQLRTVLPRQSMAYRAVCRVGSCQSDASEEVLVHVRSDVPAPKLLTTLTNGCPFLTADLSKAITGGNASGMHFTFRTGPQPDAPLVQSPGAVLAGTYYLTAQDAEGCQTEAVAVVVRIDSCRQGIAPCLSNPATITLRIDTLNWSANVVTLQARPGGSAQALSWQSSGEGLFTSTGLRARYLLSETDRQRGAAVFTVSTPDPDGSGPCAGASAKITVAAPATERTMVGLSKRVMEPVWVTEGNARLVELTYQLTVGNVGAQPLTQVQLSDDLEAVFIPSGARIRSVRVRADSSLLINSAYSGVGRDTMLLINNTLAVNEKKRLWITVRVDVSQANTLMFVNKAFVQAVDVNNLAWSDVSTDGDEADLDHNGNPADNHEPTLVTLAEQPPGESETVFIPEGFSPNADGINDYFVIKRLPPGITVQMEIYNQFGNLVYRNNDYRNDWDGTANQTVRSAGARQPLPDGTYYYQIRLSDGREYVRFVTVAR